MLIKQNVNNDVGRYSPVRDDQKSGTEMANKFKKKSYLYTIALVMIDINHYCVFTSTQINDFLQP